jgi:excisionase family DNA binding protein
MSKQTPTLITTAEAAAIIGVDPSRVRQLCRAGTLTTQQVGRDWLVDRASAVAYAATERKPGPKPAAEAEKNRGPRKKPPGKKK